MMSFPVPLSTFPNKKEAQKLLSSVLVLLLRHFWTKLGYQALSYLPSFSQLPDLLKPTFNPLCQLSHFASFNFQSHSRVTFSLTQLQEANIPTPEDTFGLLQVTKRLTLWLCSLL